MSLTSGKNVAILDEHFIRKLQDIVECSICWEKIDDSRIIIPCLHTFCLKCLENNGKVLQHKPGEVMKCPTCRMEFTIPNNGFKVLKRNFLMDKVLKLLKSDKSNVCSSCSRNNTTIEHCTDCEEDLCNDCVNEHKEDKYTKHHKFEETGSQKGSGFKNTVTDRTSCNLHPEKQLEIYCIDCENTICTSCLYSNHEGHRCGHVNSIANIFCERIRFDENEVSKFDKWIFENKNQVSKEKKILDKEFQEIESAIHRTSEQFHQLIEEHKQSLLSHLRNLKQTVIEELKATNEILERHRDKMKEFKKKCEDVINSGSSATICREKKYLSKKADKLLKWMYTFDNKGFSKISFEPSSVLEVEVKKSASENGNNSASSTKSWENLVGKLKVEVKSSALIEKKLVVVGLNDGKSITNEVFEFSVDRPNEISYLQPVPTRMRREAAAVRHYGNLFVIGIGENANEIWKFERTHGWTQCASLVHGRRRHSATIVDHKIYICGGSQDSKNKALNSVEAYDVLTNRCKTVGELKIGVMSFASVAFKGSVYIFGGYPEVNKETDKIQIYNTFENSCTLCEKSMPSPCSLLRAVLWKTSAILLNHDMCFIFDFETEIFQEREQLKPGVVHFGFILEDEKLYVIGGGLVKTDIYKKTTWTYSDEIRSVSLESITDGTNVEWHQHRRLPKSCLVQAHAQLNSLPF